MPERAVPRPPPAIARAGRALRAGSPEAALAPLREAATLRPADAALQHDLGLACLETGRLDEAVASLRRAVALRPDYVDAHFRLGLALERAGDGRGAMVALDRATELRPAFAEAWLRVGAIAFTLGHRPEAIGCFRRAMVSGRGTAIGRLGEVRALLAEARDRDAERALRRLLARYPAEAAAHDLLGNLLAEAGDFEGAWDCFARAIEAGPSMLGSYYDLVRCRRLTAADAPLIPRMRAALEAGGLPAETRIRLHLALGKAEDDLGDPGRAMAGFDAADAVRRALAPFDPDAFDRQVDRLIALFPGAGRPSPAEAGAGPAPILILGMPRSGTTLVEQILSSHEAVGAAGECNFWNERGAAWLAADRPRSDAAALDEAAAAYRATLAAAAPGAAHVTDKMPFNFLWAGLVHLACPDAILLHCRRSPIDTAISIHQTLFNPRLALPTGDVALVRYIRAYRRLMAHWRRVLPPDRLVELDYEALVGAPAVEIPRIVAACGLAWREACLHPERNLGPVRTPSRWQTRQPINRGAVGRWRRYRPWLGPLAALIGDEADGAGSSGSRQAGLP